MFDFVNVEPGSTKTWTPEGEKVGGVRTLGPREIYATGQGRGRHLESN